MRKGVLIITAATAVIALAACQPAAEDGAADAADAAAARFTAPNEKRAEASAADTAAPTSPTVVGLPAPIAQIAYAYSYGLSVPKDRGAELMSRHELTCAAAGAGYCQVVSAQADWTSRRPAGRLELRGQPEWINRFRANLALDAQNAGGKLEEAATDGEDVSRDIDRNVTGAKTTETLAQRIQALQAQRGGTMAQRLEVERQLAELQQQYDEQQVALRDLNTRVQTAKLVIDYRQGGAFAADNPTRPVAQALSDAFGVSMGVLAVLITLGSVLLPIAVIGSIVWWAAIRRRARKAAPAA